MIKGKDIGELVAKYEFYVISVIIYELNDFYFEEGQKGKSMMKATNYVPTSGWRDLESQASNFLNEVGYLAETEKKINTVRGKVEVDVFVTSKYEMLKQFICECKC